MELGRHRPLRVINYNPSNISFQKSTYPTVSLGEFLISYLWRLSSFQGSIELWVRVTNNRRADFIDSSVSDFERLSIFYDFRSSSHYFGCIFNDIYGEALYEGQPYDYHHIVLTYRNRYVVNFYLDGSPVLEDMVSDEEEEEFELTLLERPLILNL